MAMPISSIVGWTRFACRSVDIAAVCSSPMSCSSAKASHAPASPPRGSRWRKDAMLVVGSSLMVYSGYRLCEHAHAMDKPIAAINRGRTRADHLFMLKSEHGCGEVLTDLVEALSAIPALAVAAQQE
jgi:hypothetical protein